MKNLLLFSMLLFAVPAMASCYTGFACSLDALQLQDNINTIENYFVRKAIEPNYISGSPNILTYNDLFLFNTIV